MFQTGLDTTVRGYTTKDGAIMNYTPGAKMYADMMVGVGGGSDKYPVMWVKITVWEEVAEKAVEVVNRKGIPIEARGMLQASLYEGKRGVAMEMVLRNVRGIKVFDRDGRLTEVIGEVPEENKGFEN